jgi:outer membrane protein assembly factor BamA
MRHLITTFVALVLACVNGFETAAQSANAPLTVAAVEVVGVRRYTPAEVTRVSGLQTGKSITTADLDAAVQRMAATGLFKRLNYRYATAAGRTTVTLEIEEADWTMPVVFDNFVWFKDDELIAALKQHVPSFDGTAPTTDGITDLISRELQKILAARQIAGRVDFVPQGSLNKGIESFAFRVVEPAPKLCSLAFSGASVIKEQELVTVFSAVVGGDYSRSYVAATSRGTVVDLYRRRGHWRASVASPAETPVSTPSCNGAAVMVKVDEGVAYTWDRAEWSGNAAIASRDLDAIMPIKAGEVASVTRIDDGFRRVRTAYAKQGYIAQRATYVPRLDDATRKAVFDIKVEEGLQFRAGAVAFPGLAARDAELLGKQWQLQPGDVFDATYPDRFYTEVIRPRLPPGAKPPAMESQVDEKNRVVNVRFVFGK